MSVAWQMSCNRVTRPCGCAEWDEAEGGEWVHRSWPCNRCENAAREAG